MVRPALLSALAFTAMAVASGAKDEEKVALSTTPSKLTAGESGEQRIEERKKPQQGKRKGKLRRAGRWVAKAPRRFGGMITRIGRRGRGKKVAVTKTVLPEIAERAEAEEAMKTEMHVPVQVELAERWKTEGVTDWNKEIVPPKSAKETEIEEAMKTEMHVPVQVETEGEMKIEIQVPEIEEWKKIKEQHDALTAGQETLTARFMEAGCGPKQAEDKRALCEQVLQKMQEWDAKHFDELLKLGDALAIKRAAMEGRYQELKSQKDVLFQKHKAAECGEEEDVTEDKMKLCDKLSQEMDDWDKRNDKVLRKLEEALFPEGMSISM